MDCGYDCRHICMDLVFGMFFNYFSKNDCSLDWAAFYPIMYVCSGEIMPCQAERVKVGCKRNNALLHIRLCSV